MSLRRDVFKATVTSTFEVRIKTQLKLNESCHHVLLFAIVSVLVMLVV